MAERASKRQKVAQYPLVLDGQACPSGKRTVRSKAEHHAIEQGKRVELANTLDFADFEALYHSDEMMNKMQSVDMEFPGEVRCVFTPWGPTHSALLEKCFDLVQRLTQDDYANNETKWSAAKKRQEMRLPDLKYLILTALDGTSLVGFISYMVTYEDNHEVVYIYEIHVEPKYQGKSLGRQLMRIAEQTAENVGVGKVMLTVFRCNTNAVTFYERLGYGVDEYSPGPKVLRNGTSRDRSYVILSKALGSGEASEPENGAETEARQAWEDAEIKRMKKRLKRLKETNYKVPLSPESDVVTDFEASK
jgi:ribosomal protein S18 acetylase RimI-like enzyme